LLRWHFAETHSFFSEPRRSTLFLDPRSACVPVSQPRRQIPDSAETDLGRLSFLWLNGESGSRRERFRARRGHRQSKVQCPKLSGTGHDHPHPTRLERKRSPARRDKLSRRVRLKWSRRDGSLTFDIRGVDPPTRVPPVSVDPLSGDPARQSGRD